MPKDYCRPALETIEEPFFTKDVLGADLRARGSGVVDEQRAEVVWGVLNWLGLKFFPGWGWAGGKTGEALERQAEAQRNDMDEAFKTSPKYDSSGVMKGKVNYPSLVRLMRRWK